MHNSSRSTHHTSTPRRPLRGSAGGSLPAQRAARALPPFAPVALLIAGGIHGAQAARHLPDSAFHARFHAAFFLGAAAFQIVSAIRLIRGRQRGATVIAAGNLGLAAVWGVAVTAGLPDWLAPAGPQPVTFAGAAATVLGGFAASLLIASTTAASRASDRTLPSARRLGGVIAPMAVALVAIGWAVPVPAESHHHTGADSHSHDSTSRSHDDPSHSLDTGSHADPAVHLEDVHLHGLGGDEADPGPDPLRHAFGRLVGTRLRVGGHPAAVAVDGNAVWVADREAGVVHRLDVITGRSLGAATQVGVHPGGIAVGEGAVWVTNAGSDTVTRLHPLTGENLGTVSVGKVPVGVAVGAGSVWVANSAEGTVSRIDPTTGGVTKTARIGFGPTAITVVAGRPWVVTSLDRAIVSLDPETGRVATTTAVGAGATAIASGHGSIWVAGSSAGTVTRIDPATGAQIRVPIVVDPHAQPGQGPAALAVGDRVWVLNNHDRSLVAIDPSTHAVSQAEFIARGVAPHITPASLAISAGGELWATGYDSGLVFRFQPRKDTQ